METSPRVGVDGSVAVDPPMHGDQQALLTPSPDHSVGCTQAVDLGGAHVAVLANDGVGKAAVVGAHG